MDPTSCVLVGAPVDSGKTRKGCLMGPDAYRTAGLAETLIELGHTVTDAGNVVPAAARPQACANPLVHSMAETVAWAEALAPAAKKAAAVGLPIFMGGDHALSLGTVAGMAAHAVAEARPLFVLWLDAHTDLHTPLTTDPAICTARPWPTSAASLGFDAFPPMPKVDSGGASLHDRPALRRCGRERDAER